MTELMIKILTGGYLAWMAVSDARRKEIPLAPGIVCAAGIVILQVWRGGSVFIWFSGILVGIFLYAVSMISRGQVGRGDAFVYLITGTALGFAENLELLLVSLTLASIAALYLLVIRKKAGKYRIPFVPFTAAAYGVVMLL